MSAVFVVVPEDKSDLAVSILQLTVVGSTQYNSVTLPFLTRSTNTVNCPKSWNW